MVEHSEIFRAKSELSVINFQTKCTHKYNSPSTRLSKQSTRLSKHAYRCNHIPLAEKCMYVVYRTIDRTYELMHLICFPPPLMLTSFSSNIVCFHFNCIPTYNEALPGTKKKLSTNFSNGNNFSQSGCKMFYVNNTTINNDNNKDLSIFIALQLHGRSTLFISAE